MSGRWLARILRPGRFGAVLAAGLASTGAAPAFYFKGWPGDGIPRTPSVVNPMADEFGNPPSLQVFTSEDGGRWEDGPDGEETPPQHPPGVPEPASLALALAGVGVLAGSRLRKKKIVS